MSIERINPEKRWSDATVFNDTIYFTSVPENLEAESFFVKLPFSVYFGWITIATIANITAFLVSIDWDGFGISEVTWTIIILFVGVAIGILTTIRQKDIAYGLVFIWAYYGIYSKHTSESGFNGEYSYVILATLICLALIVITILFVAVKKLRK